MIAEQLKKSILQAAIQGKLTQQFPEDGDARDLLKEIRKEKSRLIKEGKIKKEKPLPEITEEDVPFEIPENWCWVRLGEIVLQNLGGGTPSKSNPDYWNGGIPWASVKDLNCKFLDSTQDNISQDGLINSSSNLVPAGNLIACTRMGLGKIVYNRIDVAINQDLRAIFVSENISKWYVYYFYLTLNFTGKGATVKGISVESLSNTSLPLPPLKEQQRIVGLIEELLPEIESLKNDETKLEELQKSFPKKMKDAILQYAIQGKLTQQLPEDGDARDLLKEIRKEKTRLIKEGKIKNEKPLPEITEDEIPFEIPENWCWVRLGELSALITDGTHKTPDYQTTGIPFLSVQNISSGKFDLSKIKYLSEKEHLVLIQRCKPEYGDILFCRIGTLGKPIINALNFDFSIFVSLALIKLVNMDCNSYLVKYLSSPSMEQWIEINKVGGGTHTNKINLRDLHMVPIPFSPIAEQKRIVKRIEELLLLCKKLE